MIDGVVVHRGPNGHDGRHGRVPLERVQVHVADGAPEFRTSHGLQTTRDHERVAAPLSQAVDGFGEIAAVLQSPRCRNCHPAGDAPLQFDAGTPHAMNITRLSTTSGLECETCHPDTNADALGLVGGPPGAPHWTLPPVDTPMVFEGLSVDALCRQLRDPSQNGGRSLDDLLAHVRDDPLVRWGWSPGGQRSVPALSHARFVEIFAAWVNTGGACPGDPVEAAGEGLETDP